MNEFQLANLERFIKNYTISVDGWVFNKYGKKLKYDLSSDYPRVTLSDDRIKKRLLVHRLIAIIYIPNPENKPCVNHKNGIKSDNRLENLEWVTYSENERHSHQVLGKIIVHSQETKDKISEARSGWIMPKDMRDRLSQSKKGCEAPNKKKVMLNNHTVFESITEASRQTGVSIGSICNNIKGLSKKTKSGIWSLM